MKRIFHALALLGFLTVPTAFAPNEGSPDITFYRIKEIVDLYEDGQYEVVKAKLANQGFVTTSTEPDYTLRGIKHEGTFTMTCETESPSASFRRFGWKQHNTWRFSTEKNGLMRDNNIDFELYNSYAREPYESFVALWSKYGLQSDQGPCNTGETCTRFMWGDVPGAPKGYREYAHAQYGYRDYQIKEDDGQYTSAPSVVGSILYRRMKNSLPSPTPRRNVTTTKRK